MKDPYQVLGVSPNATDDEIKSAYRSLVRKYHPDRFATADSALAEMANEKTKEINAAYDEIQKIRSGQYSGRTSGAGGSAAYGGPSAYNGWGNDADYSDAQPDGDPYLYTRRLINMRRLDEALRVLSDIPEAERTAEWYYLMGALAATRNRKVDAQHFFDTACGMDPDNEEYRRAAESLRSGNGAGFGKGGTARSVGCSCCDFCLTYMCVDCCCDCLCQSAC